MRIICPNCAAQYEVDADLVPEDGRDVQCSACGHTWMQFADGKVEEISTGADPVPETAEPEPEEAPAAAEPEAEPEAAATEAEGPAPEAEAPTPGGRRELDPDARRILREEAQREAARRRARRVTGMETQPDLGLEDQPAKKRRTAPPEDSDLELTAGAEARPAVGVPSETPQGTARKRADPAMFPDIEELNSTLTESGGADGTGHGSDARRGGGSFRTGFLLMVTVAILVMALYLAAPMLADRLPALRPELAAYVGAVNSFRDAVEAVLQGAAQWIEGLTA